MHVDEAYPHTKKFCACSLRFSAAPMSLGDSGAAAPAETAAGGLHVGVSSRTCIVVVTLDNCIHVCTSGLAESYDGDGDNFKHCLTLSTIPRIDDARSGKANSLTPTPDYRKMMTLKFRGHYLLI